MSKENLVEPLVSCIMPTCNRRAFVSKAIDYFLKQDYNNKELLIVDDGTDCIKDIVPLHDQVRYVRLQKNMTLGEKRNFCVRESRGDLVMHWDDDDWMAPNRIRYQVEELLKCKAEVCGLQKMLYYDIATGSCWLYKYPPDAQPWLAGNSLLYTRDFWAKAPFPDMQVASDTQFIFSRKLGTYVALEDYSFYVATVHDNNTSRKQTASSLWHPVAQDIVRKITGNEWPFTKLNGVKDTGTFITAGAVTENAMPKENAVSACLLSFKRPGNMQKIVDSIHEYPFIDEIIIWNNDISRELNVKGAKVKIINAKENSICYGRFLCAREAKNEIVYFQDDDAIVGNVGELFDAFLKNSSCITYSLSPLHFKIRDKYIFNWGQVALLGWGSFIKKTWINVLDNYLEKITAGKDYIFLREADKFFTILFGKQNNTMPAKIELLEYDSTPGISLYLENDHTFYVALAIRKALEFQREQSAHHFPVTWNIVITCMNYGHYLEEAVNSVLYNHADYIITIVDDASTDATPEICMRLCQKYPFIQYIRNEKKMGAGFARNRGLSSTESIFAILLDADDKIGHKYLFEAERLLRKGHDVVNPDAILFGETNSRWPVPETVSLSMQLERNHVHCCSAFRRSYWAQAGGIDEHMNDWEDYDFWLRLAAAGARIKKIPGNHFYYRRHGSSRSDESKKNPEILRTYIKEKNKELFKSNN